jgi:hypothetical protein
MEAPKLTGLKKRQQIQQANRTMFIWVVAAAVAFAVCVVLAQFMIRQLLFNNMIIGEKSKTQQVLDSNLTTFEELKKEVAKLNADPNLNALKINETDSVLQFIIDALPTNDDRAVLGTSLQQVVLARSGVSIESISVTQQGVVADPSGAEASNSNTPTEISFDVILGGNYDQIRTAVFDMERSIRPINIKLVKLEANGKSLRATINASTFYLPGKSVKEEKTKMVP